MDKPTMPIHALSLSSPDLHHNSPNPSLTGSAAPLIGFVEEGREGTGEQISIAARRIRCSACQIHRRREGARERIRLPCNAREMEVALSLHTREREVMPRRRAKGRWRRARERELCEGEGAPFRRLRLRERVEKRDGRERASGGRKNPKLMYIVR